MGASAVKLWSVIPAAGSGERMQSESPKQYLPLCGVPVLQRAVDAILEVPNICGIVVVLSADDAHWQSLPASRNKRVHTATGGNVRAESVLAGVKYVREQAGDDAWVLVHDAARPLVSMTDVSRLIDKVTGEDAVGGLLAVPVQDTLKLASDSQDCIRTVSRASLWQAQTPQLFRAGQLGDALLRALAGRSGTRGADGTAETYDANTLTDAVTGDMPQAFQPKGTHAQGSDANSAHSQTAGAREDNGADVAPATLPVTDEASALEQQGYTPLLIEALEPNFKITRPSDIVIAEALLNRSQS